MKSYKKSRKLEQQDTKECFNTNNWNNFDLKDIPAKGIILTLFPNEVLRLLDK